MMIDVEKNCVAEGFFICNTAEVFQWFNLKNKTNKSKNVSGKKEIKVHMWMEFLRPTQNYIKTIGMPYLRIKMKIFSQKLCEYPTESKPVDSETVG
jgi:hypothetical protein